MFFLSLAAMLCMSAADATAAPTIKGFTGDVAFSSEMVNLASTSSACRVETTDDGTPVITSFKSPKDVGLGGGWMNWGTYKGDPFNNRGLREQIAWMRTQGQVMIYIEHEPNGMTRVWLAYA